MKNKIKWEIRRDKEINNDDYIPHVSDNNSSYDIIYNNYPCFVTDNFQYSTGAKGEQWQGKEKGIGKATNKIKRGDIFINNDAKLKVVSVQKIKNNNFFILERLV